MIYRYFNRCDDKLEVISHCIFSAETLLKYVAIIALNIVGFELLSFNFSIHENQMNWVFIPFSSVPGLSLLLVLFFYVLRIVHLLGVFEEPIAPSPIAGTIAVVFPSLLFIMSFSNIAFGFGDAVVSTVVGICQRQKVPTLCQ